MTGAENHGLSKRESRIVIDDRPPTEKVIEMSVTKRTACAVASALLVASLSVCGGGSTSGSFDARGSTGTGGHGSGGQGVSYYDPNADIDLGSIDPSIDPGPDPIFTSDPQLAQDETYAYVFTRPGDHTFPPDTCVAQFDAAGAQSLLESLWPTKHELTTCTGLSLYLTASTSSLRDADLRALQILNRAEADGGLGAIRLSRLYVYNLKSMQGGVECTPESGAVWPNSGATCANTKVLGGHTWMWANGWADGWVRDLVMDDLVEAPAGAFSSAKFYALSMRGLQEVGKMAFGEQPYEHLRVLYLPSVTSIGRCLRRHARAAGGLLHGQRSRVVDLRVQGQPDREAHARMTAHGRHPRRSPESRPFRGCAIPTDQIRRPSCRKWGEVEL